MGNLKNGEQYVSRSHQLLMKSPGHYNFPPLRRLPFQTSEHSGGALSILYTVKAARKEIALSSPSAKTFIEFQVPVLFSAKVLFFSFRKYKGQRVVLSQREYAA